MRIKFKAYLKATNEMVEVNSITFTASGGMHIIPKPYDQTNAIPIGEILGVDTGNVVVQFIGMSDKKGTEIYAGDILKHTVDDRLFNWLVVFKNGCFGVQNIGINGFISWNEFHPVSGESFFIDREVIGNMYQHKHLLS